MNAMLRAVKAVVHKDSGSFRQAAFAYLASHNGRVAWAQRLYRLLGRTTGLATLLVSGYGLAAFLRVIPAGGERFWCIGRYRNEERQFEFVERCIQESLGHVRISSRGIFRLDTLRDFLSLLSNPRELYDAVKCIHAHGQRGDFLISCRVAATVGYVSRFQRILAKRTGLKGIIVSSETNPYATSICEVARDRGVRRVFITHGHMPAGPPKVDFDLWILDGPELRSVYEVHGAIDDPVVYKGAEGTFRPMACDQLMTSEFTIGVFASLLVDWSKTSAIISRIADALSPTRILVRFHPNQTIRDPDAHKVLPSDSRIEYSDGDTLLTADASRCDLVLAGNSSCHLTLLKYGVPTAYIRDLDLVPHDFYGFLSDRIVPAFERPDDLSLEAVLRFYKDSNWANRFARYDAAYGVSSESIESGVRDAFLTVMDLGTERFEVVSDTPGETS